MPPTWVGFPSSPCKKGSRQASSNRRISLTNCRRTGPAPAGGAAAAGAPCRRSAAPDASAPRGRLVPRSGQTLIVEEDCDPFYTFPVQLRTQSSRAA